MNLNLQIVTQVILQLKSQGKTQMNSHEFIQKYSQLDQHNYIQMLYDQVQKGDTQPFTTVHSQIARELLNLQNQLNSQKQLNSQNQSNSQNQLNIKNTGQKVNSENIFGEITKVELWNI